MFATNPSFTGHKSGVVLGKKSGLASIRVMAEQLGLKLNVEEESAILAKVKETSIKSKAIVSKEEFISIVESFS